MPLTSSSSTRYRWSAEDLWRTYADSRRASPVILPVEGERRELAFDGDSLRSLQLDRAYLETIAARWGQRIERIDTITELDQWTPFSRLTEDLPFYRLPSQPVGQGMRSTSRA